MDGRRKEGDWNRRCSTKRALLSAGANGVKLWVVNSRLQVSAPFDPKFVVFAHSLEGKWRKRSGIWSFQRYQYRQVVEALNSIYDAQLEIPERENAE